MYRILPQICRSKRVYNTHHNEWQPSQDLLPCISNLTEFGLREELQRRWAAEKAALRLAGVTTHRAHYHWPCDQHRVTNRHAISRVLSSPLQTNNVLLKSQRFRGNKVLVVPDILMGEYPLDVCRQRLPIAPALPLGPPVEATPDRLGGLVPFPACCAGVQICRRVPRLTPATEPAVPFCFSPCQIRQPPLYCGNVKDYM